MVANVLSPTTCESIIRAANTLGWEADQAAGGSAVDKTSVLAHNVVWLADEEFMGEFFERIKPFVQEQVGGGKVRGVNRRCRIYRYGPQQVYRVSFPQLQTLKLKLISYFAASYRWCLARGWNRQGKRGIPPRVSPLPSKSRHRP